MPSNLESKNKEARLNQNSKNSHKPPSSDIFKKERDRKTSRRNSGGQSGHEEGILRVEISFVDYVLLLIHARNRSFQFLIPYW